MIKANIKVLIVSNIDTEKPRQSILTYFDPLLLVNLHKQ